MISYVFLSLGRLKGSPLGANNTSCKETVCALLTTLSSLIAHHTSSAVDSYSLSNEPLLLCLGVHTSVTPRLEMLVEEWEDLCQESGGWEWIDGEAEGTGRNEFGGESLGDNYETPWQRSITSVWL